MRITIPQYLLLQNIVDVKRGIYLSPRQVEVRRLLKKRAIERVPVQDVWGNLIRFRATEQGRKACAKMKEQLDERMIADAIERHG